MGLEGEEEIDKSCRERERPEGEWFGGNKGYVLVSCVSKFPASSITSPGIIYNKFVGHTSWRRTLKIVQKYRAKLWKF